MGLWQRDYMAGRPYETSVMKSRRLDRTLELWLRKRARGWNVAIVVLAVLSVGEWLLVALR